MNKKEAAELVKKYEKLVNEGKHPELKEKIEEARIVLAQHYIQVFRKMR
jgi:hypothetical protein